MMVTIASIFVLIASKEFLEKGALPWFGKIQNETPSTVSNKDLKVCGGMVLRQCGGVQSNFSDQLKPNPS